VQAVVTKTADARIPKKQIPELQTPPPPPPIAPKPIEREERPSPVNPPAPASKAPPAQSVHVKPVPLSSLANKPSVKNDPKARSPENVNELKNALAAILGNKGGSSSAVKKSPAPMTPPAVTFPVKSVQQKKPLTEPVPSPQPPSQAPQEVPEDVLKKILAVD
jgi:hypothetical protein